MLYCKCVKSIWGFKKIGEPTFEIDSVKEWENPCESALWRTDAVESPYKDEYAPMRSIAGAHEPRHILLDYTHIYHLGYGIDSGASSIVLLAMLGHWGEDRKLDNLLHQAYEQYDLWCKANHRTTSIDEFSRHAFGMGGCLNSQLRILSLMCYFCGDLLFIPIRLPQPIDSPGKGINSRPALEEKLSILRWSWHG